MDPLLIAVMLFGTGYLCYYQYNKQNSSKIVNKLKAMFGSNDYQYVDNPEEIMKLEQEKELKELEEKNSRMIVWKHRIFTFVCLIEWFLIIRKLAQRRRTILKIQLIQNDKIPKYSGEVLIKRMDGLEFRSQISDISVKEIKVTENVALLRINVDKFNPLNQMKNYDAS